MRLNLSAGCPVSASRNKSAKISKLRIKARCFTHERTSLIAAALAAHCTALHATFVEKQRAGKTHCPDNEEARLSNRQSMCRKQSKSKGLTSHASQACKLKKVAQLKQAKKSLQSNFILQKVLRTAPEHPSVSHRPST